MSSTLEEREELAAREEEAREYAKIYAERMAAERARVQEELARRNACERPDDECPICFDVISEAPMRAAMPCSAKHWVCRGCLTEIASQAKASDKPSCACPHCRAEATLELLSSLHTLEMFKVRTTTRGLAGNAEVFTYVTYDSSTTTW